MPYKDLEERKKYHAQYRIKNADRIKAKYKEKYAKEKKAIIAYQKEYYSKNADLVRLRTKCRKYGLTKEALLTLYNQAGSRCEICYQEFSNEVKRNVDHDHTTGKVRGILCTGCNHGLGNFSDSPEIMLRAITYLKEKN